MRSKTEKEKENIFGDRKYFLWGRRKTKKGKKGKEENIWRRKILVCGGEEE